MKHTPNISLNHIITLCKPFACSNTTTHHKTNHKHCNDNAYKYWNRIKYYSSHLISNSHSHLQEMKSIPNMYLNHLITPCKPSACSNKAYHHKSNFQHHKYRVLQVFKWNKILFITYNQQYSFTYERNEMHSQYVFKVPYDTMQAIRLLQHNIPPQFQFPTS